MDVNLTKIWAREQIFLRGKWTRWASYRFFDPAYSVVFTELTFFDQIWAWQRCLLRKKFEKKMKLEKSVFQRLEYFDKIWAWGESSVLFEKIDVFLIKNGHERSDFIMKNLKKTIISTFLAHKIQYFRQNWRFWRNMGNDSRGSFMQSLKKMICSIVFLWERKFWEKTLAWKHCVF